MLSVHQLEKHLAGRVLLDGVSFQLEPGEKVALAGVNGSGKSTLLKICAGEFESDGGSISFPKDTTVGYLPQHAGLETDKSLYDELYSVFAHVEEHQNECDRLCERMGEVDHGTEEYERIADRYGHLQHEIDRLGAYDIGPRIEKIMAGLGFRPEDRDKPCSAFSGGWQMRILLARLLLTNPDVLLLDEPTNHLDLETMIWLENWIAQSDCTVMLVSHERMFMDALATRVFDIHEGKLTAYKGNYSAYLVAREERIEQWRREYENQLLEIEHLQKFIDRFRYNASKAAMVQSRVKALEKIERIPPPPRPLGSIHFRFPAPDRGSKEVFTLEGIHKSYGALEVLRKVDLAFWRGEKVALVGLNGAGKSTLLKMLAGIEQPTRGEIKSGGKVRTEYFAQYDEEGLTLDNTVWNEISAVAPIGAADQARSLLGGFYFSGDDLQKPVRVLSGGERTRLRLSKMLFTGANALLLDEPTNHLDIASRATLEGALKDYEGTVVFVSHDRNFIDAVATRIVEVKDGGVRSFPGNYSEYCIALKRRGESSPLIGASIRTPRQSAAQTVEGGKAEVRQEEPKPSPIKEMVKTGAGGGDHNPFSHLSSKEAAKERKRIKKRVEELEGRIAEIEERMSLIDRELLRPEIYKDKERMRQISGEKESLNAEYGAVLAEWEKLGAMLESA